MSEKKDLTIPTITGGDHLHATGRAGFAAIPLAGGAAVEVFNALITPPIEKRRREWMGAVVEAIRQLQGADASIVETLEKSEKFHSVLLLASWAAVKNHQQQKLEALRNAVLHSVKGVELSTDLQLLFIRYVDELATAHLVVMHFFLRNEKAVAFIKSYSELFDAFSEIAKVKTDPIFFKLICDDLNGRGLVRISKNLQDLPGLYEVTSLAIEKESANPKIIVTEIGRKFANFVLMNPVDVSK